MTILSDHILAEIANAPAHGVETLIEAKPESAKPHWFDGLCAPSSGFAQGLPTRALLDEQANDEPDQPTANLQLDNAFAKGVEAGRAAAQEELAERERSARELRLRFGGLDKAALDAMEAALSATVLSLCEQLFGTMARDETAFNQRCRQAAARLGEAAAGCALHLNPQDVPLLAPELPEKWRIVEDEMLERGSLLFESADGSISDGPAQWRAAIAEAIGASDQLAAPENPLI